MIREWHLLIMMDRQTDVWWTLVILIFGISFEDILSKTAPYLNTKDMKQCNLFYWIQTFVAYHLHWHKSKEVRSRRQVTAYLSSTIYMVGGNMCVCFIKMFSMSRNCFSHCTSSHLLLFCRIWFPTGCFSEVLSVFLKHDETTASLLACVDFTRPSSLKLNPIALQNTWSAFRLRVLL